MWVSLNSSDLSSVHFSVRNEIYLWLCIEWILSLSLGFVCEHHHSSSDYCWCVVCTNCSQTLTHFSSDTLLSLSPLLNEREQDLCVVRKKPWRKHEMEFRRSSSCSPAFRRRRRERSRLCFSRGYSVLLCFRYLHSKCRAHGGDR